MKYTILLLLTISSLPAFAMNGLYQLPDTKEISKRLTKVGLHNFARESKIADAIGDRCFQPLYLHTYVTSEIQRYNSTIHEWTYDFQPRTHSKQPTVSIVMTLLLQDYPRALTALEKNYDGAFLR